MNEVNNGNAATYPMMTVLARNPLMASAISKAVEQPTNTGASTIRDPKTGALASMGEMHQISRYIQQDIQTYENFFQLFPDMNIDRMILVGAILAPNNMFREDLNYALEMDGLDSILAGTIVQVIEETVDRNYGVVRELRKIVDNALFHRGSHIKLVIPESAVDYLINSGYDAANGIRLESATKLNELFNTDKPRFSMGFLGNAEHKGKTSYRAESFRELADSYDPKVKASARWEKHEEMKKLVEKGLFTITDDPSNIKKSFYMESFSREMVRDRVDANRKAVDKIRMESRTVNTSQVQGEPEPRANMSATRVSTIDARTAAGDINIDKLREAIFKASPTNQDFFARIPRLSNLERHSIGRCLYIDGPSEAFIPIHYPGEPDRHAGYMALIDPSSGYFLTLESQKKYLSSFVNQQGMFINNQSSNSNANQSLSTSMVERAAQNLASQDQTVPLRYHPEIFGSLFTEEFLERVQNGPQGLELEAEMSNTIAYIMMARSNAGRQTQVVYIPADFVSYFAFDHNANGTGRSLLAGVTNLLSLRAAALYARVANQIRNAISITDVKVILDPRDHQPQRTLMKVVDLVTQSRAQFFPWGLNSASDIWAWWNRAGYQLNVEGHPAIPSTKVEYQQRSHEHHIPDIADDGYLKDMVGHHMGITPDMKDAGEGAEFATAIANSNILFANRAHGYQLLLNPQITNHVRRIVYNDSEIYAKVRGAIADKWSEIQTTMPDDLKTAYDQVEESEAIDNFMRRVVDNLKVSLPPPEITTLENQAEAFEKFCSSIDTAKEHVFKDEALSNLIYGEHSAKAAEMIELMVAQAKRNYMQKNGYLSELFDILSVDEKGQPTSTFLNEGIQSSVNMSKNIQAAIRRFSALGVATQKDLSALEGQAEPGQEDTPPASDDTTGF